MNQFLPHSAEYIFKKHSLNELANICIILPTRRGVYFLKEAFSKLSDKPFIAPNILAVDDFVLNFTGLIALEPIDLLFELYESYSEIDKTIVFEKFITWAPTLLQDFDRIDQYLVNAEGLFEFMTQAKAIERWGEEAHSNKPLEPTSADKYFQLFSTLSIVYNSFRAKLIHKKKVYRGLAYRKLAENVEQHLINKSDVNKYYFLGFNALSNSEEVIIDTLCKAKKAETLWDSDSYYMDSPDGSIIGKYLKKYKQSGKYGQWNWQKNYLTSQPKNIKIIGLTSASQQAKVASHYLGAWFNGFDKNVKNNNTTALVLADENLLGAFINTIPNDVPDFNITMGLSLRNSSFFSLIDSVFELHKYLKQDKENFSFIGKNIAQILNHPIVRKWEKQKEKPFINAFLAKNEIENKYFITQKDIIQGIKHEELIIIFFVNWKDKPANLLSNLLAIANFTREILLVENDQIEAEYLLHFFKILTRLQDLYDRNTEQFTIASTRALLYELIKQVKLSFESEPISSLQIMGLLETRTLDFDRVLISSVNENFLPSGKKVNSLIPFDAMTQNGMPTSSDQDAVMAYHFFRLLQCAKEVVLLYSLPTATYGGYEKSRFIFQIEHELKAKNKNLTIEYPNIKYEGKDGTKQIELQIEKTEEIIILLKDKLINEGIYPSHMNMFLSCSMKYYLSKVVKIAVDEELKESLESNMFGDWIHKTLENIDLGFIKNGGVIKKEDVLKIIPALPAMLKKEFQNEFKNLIIDEGKNFISYTIAQQILTQYFQYQLDSYVFPIIVLDVEKKLEAVVEVDVNGELIPIKLAGKLDRIDVLNNEIRIIDFKTGIVEKKHLGGKNSDKKPVNLNDLDHYDKQRQLWLYKYLFTIIKNFKEPFNFKNPKHIDFNLPIVSGIYSFRNTKEGFLKRETFFSDNETETTFLIESKLLLTEFINKLLDINEPFSKTENIKTCEYCNYKGICER